LVPRCQVPGGHPQRLGRRIHGKGGTVTGPAALDDGQADARAGDRGADSDGIRVIAGANGQPAQPFGLFNNIKNIA
jgi:hypothetical protein